MGALLDEALPLAHHLQMPDLILEALYYSITKYGNNLLDDAEETRKRSEECIALAHLAGNRFFLVFILGFRSWYIIHDAHERMQSTREAYQVALELGNARALSEALAGLGHMYRSQGQYEKATLAVKECLRLSKELGDKYEEVWFHWALSNIENQKGDLTLGQRYAEEGLLLARDLSDPLYTSYTLLGLGWNAYLRGDYGQARRCLEESLAIRREPGVMSFILSPLICLGRVALAQGEEEEACTFFREALELFTLTSKYWLLADCLERMSGLSSLSAEAAARLLGSAEAMRAREGTLIPASERDTYGTFVEKVRMRLGEEAFQAAWSEGGRMSSPETAAFAARCLDAGESDRLQNSPQQTSQLDHPVGPGAFGEGQDHDL
jgi:tetratricopeptide (TPR) repeat protein